MGLVEDVELTEIRQGKHLSIIEEKIVKMQKALHIMKNIFTNLLVIVAVAMMIFTVISVSTFDRLDRNLFGYRAFIVLSDSMSKTDFEAGDLILVKEVDPTTLQVGDIISFQSTSQESYGEVITHKIREITTGSNGLPVFVTYGTTTGIDDTETVSCEYVLGKYEFHLPNVGTFFRFLKTTPGYIVCIFIPFLLLIGIQGMNSIKLFKQYKAEQLEELQAEKEKERAAMQAERERLEEERQRSQEMMAELMKMKEAIAASIPNPEKAGDPAVGEK